MRALGLGISNKSALLMAPGKVRTRVLQFFRKLGVQLTCVVAAEDLGTTALAFPQRRVAHQRARFIKGSQRAARVGVLRAVSTKATKLYATGVKPQEGYDVPSLGVAPTQRARARRSALKCCGSPGYLPCVRSTKSSTDWVCPCIITRILTSIEFV